MEICGRATAGGVGATGHPWEMPARETQAQGTGLVMALAHGTRSSHVGPGTSPNRLPCIPPQRPPTLGSTDVSMPRAAAGLYRQIYFPVKVL